MSEIFHTFLKPIIFSYQNTQYYVYGYCSVDGKPIEFSATTDIKTPWTKAEAYFDKNMVEEFSALLPPEKVKRKRKTSK